MSIPLSITMQPWPGQPSAVAWPRQVMRWQYTSRCDGMEDWALALAPVGDSRTWIINLHGHGSTGDQLYTRADIRQRWLPVLLGTGFGILTPNLRGNAWMSPQAAADLHDLIDHLRQAHDGRRFILVSGSMGGTGSLIYATQHPQDIAGVVALCPATDLPGFVQWCGQRTAHPIIAQIRQAILTSYRQSVPTMQQHATLAHVDRLAMPVFVVHGDADVLIPVDHSRQLAQAMVGRGNFHYIEQPGGNHDAPLWLMDQGLTWVMAKLAAQGREHA